MAGLGYNSLAPFRPFVSIVELRLYKVYGQSRIPLALLYILYILHLFQPAGHNHRARLSNIFQIWPPSTDAPSHIVWPAIHGDNSYTYPSGPAGGYFTLKAVPGPTRMRFGGFAA